MTVNPRVRSVAIIGAGPAGMVLAISLSRYGIQSHIYELRTPEASLGGSLSLQPNGLRILDAIGLYSRLRPKGFSNDTMYIRNIDTGDVKTEGGDLESAYGYKRLRVSRSILLEELHAATKECGIPIEYGFKLSHIVSESKSGVTFASAEGSERTADILVGADGIYSRVREYIAPSIQPEYTGLLGLGVEVPRSALRFPTVEKNGAEERLPVTLRHRGDMFTLVPQASDGSAVFTGKAVRVEGRSRAEWKAFEEDKETLHRLYCEGMEEWPDIVQSALEAADPNKFIFWPIHTMPRLGTWISPQRRVALLGDAAHAVPPTTGQGVNTAFEDSYMLASALAKVPEACAVEDALSFWSHERQTRVHEMVDKLLGKGGPLEAKSRVTSKEDGKENAQGRGDEWLYGIDVEGAVHAWAQSKSRCS